MAVVGVEGDIDREIADIDLLADGTERPLVGEEDRAVEALAWEFLDGGMGWAQCGSVSGPGAGRGTGREKGGDDETGAGEESGGDVHGVVDFCQ